MKLGRRRTCASTIVPWTRCLPSSALCGNQILDALVTVSAPHRLGGGSEDIDFFSFLVGFAVLDALHSCEDGALDLVYSLLDADGVGKVPRSRVDVALQLRPDDASIRDDAFISVDALEEVDEDPLLDAEAFRAHVRANRERLSRTWSV